MLLGFGGLLLLVLSESASASDSDYSPALDGSGNLIDSDGNIVTDSSGNPVTTDQLPGATLAPRKWITPSNGQQFDPLFDESSDEYAIPAGLLSRIAKEESNYNPNAKSPTNSNGTYDAGLMQINSTNIAASGINPYDPASAIDYAAQMLATDYARFGTWSAAVAAYNAGPNAVSTGKIPASTRAYVASVMVDTGLA